MALRIITSVVGLVIFFAAFFAGEFFFAVAAAIVSVGMVWEAMTAINPGKSVKFVSIVFSVLFFLAVIILQIYADFYRMLYYSGNVDVLEKLALMLFTIIFLVVTVFAYLILSVKNFNKTDSQKIHSSAFMMLYITLFMAFILLLRFDFGRYAVLPVFLFSWVTDSGAYFAGRFFGRHKLAPNLSPKKTVEGAIDGILTTVIASVIYIIVLKNCFNTVLPNNVIFVIAAAFGAVLSEVGDLVASVVKRHCGIKDFGNIFPGHGGFLDRFDSVVFVAPYVYFIFIIMQIVH